MGVYPFTKEEKEVKRIDQLKTEPGLISNSKPNYQHPNLHKKGSTENKLWYTILHNYTRDPNFHGFAYGWDQCTINSNYTNPLRDVVLEGGPLMSGEVLLGSSGLCTSYMYSMNL